MSASQETLKAKMRARRRKMEDTSRENSDVMSSSNNLDHTWEAAMEEPLHQGSSEVGEEAEERAKASELHKKLRKTRKRAEQQLETDLTGADEADVKEQVESAKRKTRQRVLDEASRTEESGTEVEEGSSIPKLAEDEGGVAATTLDVGSRPSSVSPRRMVGDGSTTKGDRKMSSALNQSLRARLTEKMRVAKDKGKDEVYDESKATGRRLAHKRDTVRTTRFDDPSLMRKEDLEAMETLEKSISMRNKWKESIQKTKTSHLPTREEAYDFFTRVWEPDPEEEPQPQTETLEAAAAATDGKETTPKETAAEFQPGTSAEGADDIPPAEAKADAGERETGEEGKVGEENPLLEDLDAEEDSWRYYYISPAKYVPHQQQLDNEDKAFFYPSILEAPISDKIFEQEEPRYLEEEGFYVGTKPSVPNRNVSKMENRLLQEAAQGQRWFGEDGKLIALPDPLKETPDRPPIWEEMIPELETEYKKAMPSQLDSRYIQPVSGLPAHYQLDVDVNTVSFTHHHLYSREHVLVAKLNHQYQQHVSRTRRKTAEFLTQKLKALKSAASTVEKTIASMQAEEKPPPGLSEQKQRLHDYQKEIRQTRTRRDTELVADRTLLKNIIKTWKDIKSLRQFQGCTNTSLKLQITKELSNKEADQAQWDADIEEELAELREDAQIEYHEQLDSYRRQLESWKTQRLQKKEATKRQRHRERHPEQEDRESLEAAARDQEILSDYEIPKPEKPRPVKDAELKERIVAKYNETRRQPGEARIYLELSSGATITPNNQCPKGEQQRRSDVSKTKLYVRVLFNDKEVARTPAKPLGIDFMIRFTQIFNIEILKWPESIKLEIVESSGLSSMVLSEVYMAVPEAHICSDNVQLDAVEFSSYERVRHSHEGVGSGVPFSFEADGSNKISLHTTAALSTSVAWAADEDGNVLVPPSGAQQQQQHNAVKSVDAVAALGVGGMADMNKLTEWIAESHLDPNDPSNSELMYLLRPVARGGDTALHMQLPSHYRLEQLQEEFNFATDRELEESKRFKMITLREKEEPHFQSKQVPAFDKEIPDEVFLEYEKEKAREDKISKLDDGSHRAAVAQFMQKVREQVIARFRIAAHQKALSDVVFEEAVPNISNVIPSLMKIAEPRRPLKPIRKERKKITAQNLQGVDVKVLINIVRAFDIPVRSEATQRNVDQGQGRHREGATRNIGGESTLVRPLVEVLFQRNTEMTSVAEGPNPSWNEELQLPFKAPNNDYSTTNLQTVNDIIYINLFDEFVVDVTDDHERGTSIHRRIEKRWLGSLKVPFSTVYFNSRIDGTFRLQKPPVLLGYTQDNEREKLDTGFDIGMGSGEHTYLTMFITVEPALTPPEPAKEKFDSNEEEELLEACDRWQQLLIKKFPKREYKATVVNLNGKSVFLTRYFKPLKPPEVLINGQESPEATAEAVARYVSMIPSVSDSVVFPGMCDIWSTCDQFLSMLQGDEEEHAVLLTNYFLYLGLDAWLVLGSAVPEGPTAYVISRNKEQPKNFVVWNATTGEHYSHKDNYCPIQSVGCLVNQDNIWANIQPYEQPSQISFDLSNSSSWKPFFTKSNPHPGIPSVQPEQLLYVETDRVDVVQIQEKIERLLKEKIMDWRPRNVTRWNRYCISSFRRLLEKLEHSRGKGAQQQHSAELDQILGSYKMCGFPINLPYTELEPIVESVYATGVHKAETNEVEFALAVHVHPYPHNVLSVWVYVASLVRKR